MLVAGKLTPYIDINAMHIGDKHSHRCEQILVSIKMVSKCSHKA